MNVRMSANKRIVSLAYARSDRHRYAVPPAHANRYRAPLVYVNVR
jgi:hypothetical protein